MNPKEIAEDIVAGKSGLENLPKDAAVFGIMKAFTLLSESYLDLLARSEKLERVAGVVKNGRCCCRCNLGDRESCQFIMSLDLAIDELDVGMRWPEK